MLQQPTRQRQPSFKQDEQASTSSLEYEQSPSSTPTSSKSKSSRSVIPSKRAAQNRAAQKAFRQRREQYIKDLEIKAKEMEDWQTEMDNLRKENKDLRDRVIVLENQVHVLTGGDPNKLSELEKLESQPIHMIKRGLERSMSLPITKNPETIETIPKRPSESRLRQEEIIEDQSPKESSGPFVPVPLRAPNHHHQHHHPPPPFETSYEESKKRKIEEHQTVIGQAPIPQPPLPQQEQFTKNMIQPPPPPSQQPPPSHPPQMQYAGFWENNNNNNNTAMPEMPPNPQAMNEFELDFDFDPFFEDEFGPTLANNNDFLPNANSNQVLDDLFAMLQTRQRPQIPMIPSEDNNNNNNNTVPTTDPLERIG